MLVTWNEATDALGYDLIDAGHQLVVELINRLNEDDSAVPVQRALDMLAVHLPRQFHHEEAVMMLSRSPRLEAQRREHRDFLATLEHLRALTQDGEDVGAQVLLNLVAFLVSHLRGSDVEEFSHVPCRWVA